MLKACLNGGVTRAQSAAVPLSPAELAADAALCHAAGALAFHIHPRAVPLGTEQSFDTGCRESLAAPVIGAAVAAIRRAVPGVPIGVSTGAWIEPRPLARVVAVRSWATLPAEARPDFASVNAHEAGAPAVAEALHESGIGVEAGLWTPAAVLAYRGWTVPCLRVLVELTDADPDRACDDARLLLALLGGDDPPVLLHAEGPASWVVLREAVDRGLDTRIGLEDTLTLPDGSTASNASLVAHAAALGAR